VNRKVDESLEKIELDLRQTIIFYASCLGVEKNCVADPGYLFRIPDPTFSIPDPGQKDPGAGSASRNSNIPIQIFL
jgi:hypothetical protein